MKVFNKLIATTAVLLSASILQANEVKFEKTLKSGNITFQVTCPNNSSLNRLTIRTSGIKNDANITTDIEGMVTDAEVADLDNDGAPEVYIFITSAGSGSYRNVVAYSSNKNLSISGIYFPELNEKSKEIQGYMGHDKFFLAKDRLTRTFPIYKEKDSNANPTGGTRTIEYKLVPGEATWQLKPVKN